MATKKVLIPQALALKLLKALENEVDSMKAVLNLPEAIDALCAEDVFGEHYEEGLSKAIESIEKLIKQARTGRA